MKKLNILIILLLISSIFVLSGCEQKTKTLSFENQNNCIADVAIQEDNGWSCEQCLSEDNQLIFNSGGRVQITCKQMGSIFID